MILVGCLCNQKILYYEKISLKLSYIKNYNSNLTKQTPGN